MLDFQLSEAIHKVHSAIKKKKGRREVMLTVMEWPIQSPEHNPITPISPAMKDIGLKGLKEGPKNFGENRD